MPLRDAVLLEESDIEDEEPRVPTVRPPVRRQPPHKVPEDAWLEVANRLAHKDLASLAGVNFQFRRMLHPSLYKMFVKEWERIAQDYKSPAPNLAVSLKYVDDRKLIRRREKPLTKYKTIDHVGGIKPECRDLVAETMIKVLRDIKEHPAVKNSFKRILNYYKCVAVRPELTQQQRARWVEAMISTHLSTNINLWKASENFLPELLNHAYALERDQRRGSLEQCIAIFNQVHPLWQERLLNAVLNISEGMNSPDRMVILTLLRTEVKPTFMRLNQPQIGARIEAAWKSAQDSHKVNEPAL